MNCIFFGGKSIKMVFNFKFLLVIFCHLQNGWRFVIHGHVIRPQKNLRPYYVTKLIKNIVILVSIIAIVNNYN